MNMITTKPKVMIVEDEDLLLQAIVKKLQVFGMDSITFESGKDAIEFLEKGTEIPNAIWLDYHLKDMDGLLFMTRLKDNKPLSNIPVIVVSNSATNEKINNMLALGAKKYLLKAEHRLDNIVGIVKDLVSGKKQPS